MELVFRIAEEKEMSTAFSLLREAALWLNHKGINYWQDWLSPAPEYINWIKSGFENNEFYFTLSANQIVGMFRLQFSDEMFWGKSEDRAGYIHSLTTKRDLKGRGIGRAILDHLENSLVDRGIDFLRLDCSSSIEGLCRYYESNGFKTAGTVSIFGETMTLYEKDLRPCMKKSEKPGLCPGCSKK